MIEYESSQVPGTTDSVNSVVGSVSQLSVMITSTPITAASGMASHSTVTSVGTPVISGAVVS